MGGSLKFPDTIPCKSWPIDGGEMGALIRAKDWSQSPLGPVEAWPAALRAAIDIILGSPLAMVVLWGDDHLQFYNDAYRRIAGEKHPKALGGPNRESWPEIWALCQSVYEAVKKGEQHFYENQPLTIMREGRPVEERFGLTLGPIRDEAGAAAGILITVLEVENPSKVDPDGDIRDRMQRSEERFAFLLFIADRKRSQTDSLGVKSVACSALGEFIRADRIGYVEVQPEKGAALLEGEWSAAGDSAPENFRLDEAVDGLTAPLQQGRFVCIDDAADVSGCFLGKSFAAAIFMPVMKQGRLIAVFYVLQHEPRHWREDEISLAREVAGRIWASAERADAVAEVQTSERLLRTLVEGIPQLVWRSAKDGDWRWASPQWMRYTGLSPEASLGQGWLDAIHPDDRDAARVAWREAEAKLAFVAEYRIWRAKDESYRFFQTRASPVLDENGTVLEWLGASTEIDEMRRLQDTQRTLVAELQHRTRNLLAVVRSIGDQTDSTGLSKDAFWERLAPRIDALSRVQKILSRSNAAPITLQEILEAEFETLRLKTKNEIRLAGSKVALPSEMVQTLALAFHELATNALKYGALKKGRLDVEWSVDETSSEPTLVIDWRESGVGLPEETPEHRGFGRALIEGALPYEYGGKTDWNFARDGVRCRMRLPFALMQ